LPNCKKNRCPFKWLAAMPCFNAWRGVGLGILSGLNTTTAWARSRCLLLDQVARLKSRQASQKWWRNRAFVPGFR
jgi:hypothetical protein